MLDQVQPVQPVEARTARSADELPWCEKHHQIVRDEIEAINTRRDETRQLDTDCLQSCRMLDVTGLALSGGGIRSSALCLGVLQALNHHDLIGRIDYLSTVSGGGYIGTSLSATMTKAQRFVFGERPVGETITSAEISDTPSVGHLRNYSNYLIPAGARDLLTGIAIVVRGLVANVGLTLPIVLLLAAVTIWSTPLRSCLTDANIFGVSLSNKTLCELHDFSDIDRYGFSTFGLAIALLMFLCSGLAYLTSRSVRGSGPSVVFAYIGGIALLLGVACDFARFLKVQHFALTLAIAIIGGFLFFGWALKQSLASPGKRQVRSHWPSMGATYLVVLAVIAFFEFQPFMLGQMFDVAESNAIGGPAAAVAITWIKSLAAVAAPIGVVVTAFRQQFAELLKGNSASSQWGAMVLKVVAKVALWIAGLALPLIIWVAYLYLSYWGIANDLFERCPAALGIASQRECLVSAKSNALSGNLAGKIQFDASTGTFSAEITPKAAPPVAADTEQLTPTWHAPAWLQFLAEKAGIVVQERFPGLFQGSASELTYAFSLPMVILYTFAGVVLFAISFFLTPNANSLHRLYRDRLSKAFLFDPTRPADGGIARAEASLDQGRDFKSLDRMKLTDLYAAPAGQVRLPGQQPPEPKLRAPYQLINAALNIQGSDFANRRGRNADFFLFSARNIGSEATGYAPTGLVEDDEQSLDLATAMAISGAAASANMGSSSIKALTPTLALLNVRLGYWLKNPRYVDDRVRPQRRSTPLYFWSEISGRLYENSDSVYLTDGGHIEKLGVYELLRRRCKVIIAVDAEADAPMNFGSLMTLQRYARIDLGIRIDLPWTPIRERTRALMARNADKAGDPAASDDHDEATRDHVHVAIGTIDYGGDEEGYLVYIKSSLNGDENDYIRDYARRNDRFPHETTGDQFFSEEQFEVYRALGFHMAHGFLSGDNPVVVGCGVDPRMARFTESGEPAIDAVREALGLAVPERRAANVTAAMIDQG